MNELLSVKNVIKSFSGNKVLNGLSFKVDKGEILGVLGANGAGKSTTFNILSGLISADSGIVSLGDNMTTPATKEYKQSIGIVPQDISLYNNMTVEENLKFIGKLYGIRGKKLSLITDEILDEVNLSEKKKDYIKNLSGGMKRRVNIASALLHEPKLVIMDEPTVGVDPQSRAELLKIIKQLKQKGRSVIYTSHYVDEIERLSDRVIIIKDGKVSAEGTVNQLVGKYCRNYVYILQFYSFNDSFCKELKRKINVVDMDTEEYTVKIYTDSKTNILEYIVQTAVELDLTIKNIDIKKPNLEDVFFYFNEKGNNV